MGSSLNRARVANRLVAGVARHMSISLPPFAPRTLVVCAVLALCACEPAKAPPTRETIHLTGTPYERGLQHGRLLKSKIHSFYTTLLTNSLLPYLAREQPDIASLLSEYGKDQYLDGKFGYQLLLDSAKTVTLDPDVRQELRGIADGSGLPYEQVLVMNTFFDSTLAVRGVALAIRLARAPQIQSVEFIGAGSDGVDNNGDGQTDEAGEGLASPYIPVPRAVAVEVPTVTKVKIVLKDPDSVDPATIRVRVADVLYTQGDPALTLTPVGTDTLEVLWVAPQALPAGTYSLVLSAGDGKVLENPPPSHASFMRDEEMTFTVKGTGVAFGDVVKPPLNDGRTRPPPIAVGVRKSATADGSTLLAQHFALLDANTSYKHTVLFVHHPDNGPAFAYAGWAGIAFGMAGLSNRGVGYACNPSDTLNNSVVGSVLANALDLSKAKLTASGTPIGFVGRKILETAATTQEAQDIYASSRHVTGWHCVLADASGAMSSVENTSDIFKDVTNNGVFTYGPDDLDSSGRRFSGARSDDLEIGSCNNKTLEDIKKLTIAGQTINPQRAWSSFYYRSRRAQDALKRMVTAEYGTLTPARLEAFIADPEVVDKSDSMNAVVIDVTHKTFSSAMGAVPATSVPFEDFTLGAEVSR